MARLTRGPRRSFVIVLSMFVLSASIIFGSALSASGESDDVTFHACLHQGNLLQVSTAPQTCKVGMPISWNEIGPQGPQGEQGPRGPQGEQGPKGEPGESATLNPSQLYTLELLDGQRCDAAPQPGIDLSHCVLFERNFAGADLSGAIMVETDLTLADLRNANLSGANMVKVNLRAADLTDAILSGADLTEATMSETNLVDADMSGAILEDANMFAVGAVGTDLSSANLKGADLSFANLTDANLLNADLTFTDLTDVTWGNTTCPNGTNSDDAGFCTPG